MLLSRTELSRKNGWIEDGKIYIIYTNVEVMEKIGCCEQKAIRLMRKLEEYGLIERYRKHKNDAYRIFLKQPAEITAPDDDIQRAQPVNYTVQDTESHSSRAVKINDKIDREEIDRDSQYSIDSKNTYGINQNVLLTDEELSLLKSEFSSDYQERIDRLSNYMSANNKVYNNHLATIRLWASKEKPRKNKPDYDQLKGVSL